MNVHQQQSARHTRSAISLAAIVACAAVTGCAPAPQPHALTTSESQALAIARFKNFAEGTRAISISVLSNEQQLGVHGYFDYASGAGVAQVWIGASPPENVTTNLLWWTDALVGEYVSLDAAPDMSEEPPLDLLEQAGWEYYELDGQLSPLMAMLATTAALGFDRPDNPLLLVQTDALWLGDGELPLPSQPLGTWYQLPSSDEARTTPISLSANPATPRVLLDEDSMMWSAERVLEGLEPSVLEYGRTVNISIPVPIATEPNSSR
ncbi:hypothetical protein [Microbacterium sp. NPDC076911]|uniref:hypothetical protein n=1 Tax=Microbacterium sp. NPDC076911 TaxID=3154958 RepID=UPI0034496CF2